MSDPVEAFLALQEDGLAVLRDIQSLHRALADHPEPGGPSEAELAQAVERRDALALPLGRALLQLLAHGTRLATVGAEPEVPAPPALPPGDPMEVLVEAALAGPEAPVEPTPEPAPAYQRLRKHADDIGPPFRVTTLDEGHQMVQRLVNAVHDRHEWLSQPTHAQRALLGLLSSLARHLQDESHVELSHGANETLKSAFSRMTAWSGEHRPGFVRGLSRDNAPDHGSWLDDARYWWQELVGEAAPREAPRFTPEEALARIQATFDDGIEDDALLSAVVRDAVDAGVSQSDARLVRLLTPHQERLKGAVGLKTLKGQLRNKLREDEPAPVSEPPIPESWPLRPFTEGMRAVIVGGDPRPEAVDRIRDAFGFGTVEWVEKNPRRVLGVADQVRGGTVGMVLALRSYIEHADVDMLRPTCKAVGVPFCLVDTGYGVTQVRLAIERYCAGPS